MNNIAAVESQPTEADSQRVLRQWIYSLIIVTAVAVQFVRIVTVTALYSPAAWPRRQPVASPLLSANDRSRWCTVWSLAERGTFQIDEIIRQPGWYTIDMVNQNDHFYSSKPPLLPVLVAGMYWTLKRVTGQDLLLQTHGVVQELLLIINLLPFAISLFLISRLVERHARSDLTRIFVVFSAAFGTFLSTFLNTFNNHTVAANCVLWSVYAALRIIADGERRWHFFALSGFCAAIAVANELPAAIFLVVLAAWLWRCDARQTLIAFVPFALVPIIAHVGLTVLQTGSFKPFYAGFGTELYNFKNSYWLKPQGVDKALDSPFVYFIHCTIGHHGLISLTPLFLITIQSWLQRPAKDSRDHGLIYWLSLICTVVVLAFYMTRTAQYNYGGRTSGLRWMFWLTPLWLCATIPVLDDWLARPWARRLCLVLLAVSVFSVTYPWNNPWTHPWLFQVMQQAGWISY